MREKSVKELRVGHIFTWLEIFPYSHVIIKNPVNKRKSTFVSFQTLFLTIFMIGLRCVIHLLTLTPYAMIFNTVSTENIPVNPIFEYLRISE